MVHSRERPTPIPSGNIVGSLRGHVLVVECPMDAMRLNTTQHPFLAEIERNGLGLVLWKCQGAWAIIPTPILQNILQLEDDYAVGQSRSRMRTPSEVGVVRWRQAEPITSVVAMTILTSLKKVKEPGNETPASNTRPDSKTN